MFRKIKNLLKEIILSVLNFVNFFLPKQRAVILLYHSISSNGAFLSVLENDFVKQMDFLKNNNYKIISLEELVEKIKNHNNLDAKTVVLTFDDGYISHYDKVTPVLSEYNFPATFFVTLNLLGKSLKNTEGFEDNIMSVEQVRELSNNSLFSIEPHTLTHKELTSLNSEEILKEVVGSKNNLENLIGKPNKFFAYPRGKYNQQIKKILLEKGFEAAVITRQGTVGLQEDLFELPRNTIDASCSSLNQFKAHLNWSSGIFYSIFK